MRPNVFPSLVSSLVYGIARRCLWLAGVGNRRLGIVTRHQRKVTFHSPQGSSAVTQVCTHHSLRPVLVADRDGLDQFAVVRERLLQLQPCMMVKKPH